MLDLLDKFNWLDRLQGILLDLFQRGGWQITCTRAQGGTLIEDTLRIYHVPIWGRTVKSKTLSFHVKRKQAQWAEYILLRAGVDVQEPLFEPRNRQWAARYQTRPPAWDEQKGKRPWWLNW